MNLLLLIFVICHHQPFSKLLLSHQSLLLLLLLGLFVNILSAEILFSGNLLMQSVLVVLLELLTYTYAHQMVRDLY